MDASSSREWDCQGILYYRVPGLLDAALAAHRRAAALDPLSPVARFNEGLTLSLMGRLEDAVTCASWALELFPHHVLGIHHVSLILARAGLQRDAGALVNRGFAIAPDSHYLFKAAARVFRTKQDLTMLLRRIQRTSTRTVLPPVVYAFTFLALNERERALRWFRRCVEWHDVNFLTELHDPLVAELRDDIRFQELLSRLGVV